MSTRIILYSKPGCHLCEGLQEKLEQIQTIDFELEIRDITTREDWFQAYQYEIPVLFLQQEVEKAEDVGRTREVNSTQDSSSFILPSGKPLTRLHPLSFIPLPRPSPRATVHQLAQMLQKYLQTDRTQ